MSQALGNHEHTNWCVLAVPRQCAHKHQVVQRQLPCHAAAATAASITGPACNSKRARVTQHQQSTQHRRTATHTTLSHAFVVNTAAGGARHQQQHSAAGPGPRP
jgi:hypothetical protein